MTTPFSKGLRLHGKTPRINHVFNSEAMLVRNAIFDRIKLMSFFTSFKFGSDSALSIQPETLPYCGVYLLGENMIPEGDPNAGEVRFRSVAQIGISVIIANNDSAAAEMKLDAANQVILIKLLSDPTLYNWSGKYGPVKIQSFPQCDRAHVFGNVGKDQQTPSAELRLMLSCDLGTIMYPPEVLDDLETIRVETLPPGGDENTTRIISEYDIEQ